MNLFDIFANRFLTLSKQYVYNQKKYQTLMLSKQHISYNRAIEFMNDLQLSQLIKIIEFTSQICQQCYFRKKNHYCIDPNCTKKQLICWNCDAKNIKGKHYMHQFSFVLPLFSKDIFLGFIQMKENFVNFQARLVSEIQKIKSYIQKLQKINDMTTEKIKDLNNEQKIRNFQCFRANIRKMIQNPKGKKLSDVMDKICFISSNQCLKKEEQIRRTLLQEIEKLKWLQDPQKELKKVLKFERSEDSAKQVFLSSNTPLQFSQIDSYFRLINEYFVQTLSTHKVQLKIESDLMTRSKFYEAFIYHFRDCQSLSIHNGNINHIKTPLSFKNLKRFQFNCNIETDNLTAKLQNSSNKLSTFKIRRFRQDDIKILKGITNQCKDLKDLHLQFYNKCDLSGSKQLIDYLNSECEKVNRQDQTIFLRRFVLKIRTQSQVKRLYGYLSKFCKQNPEPSHTLSNCLIDFLAKNRGLTKVIIEGVRPLNAKQIMKQLEKMPYLMNYKVYYDNIDMMEELDDGKIKKLKQMCQTRKRAFYILCKNTKNKRLSKNIMKDIIDSII